MAQLGSLLSTESSKDYLDLIKQMVEGWGVQSATEPTKFTSINPSSVQAELPPSILLPMLPVTEGLKEVCKCPAFINILSRHYDALYKVDKASA